MKKLMFAAVVFAAFSRAILGGQSLAVPPAQDLSGTWQGTLRAGRDLRTVIKIARGDEGTLKGTMYSIDQSGQGIPLGSVTLEGSTVRMSVPGIGGSFEGRLSSDRNSIAGTWTQGGAPLQLNLARATNETAWSIPEPPARPTPMAADANPAFEVATIKPSRPDAPGRGVLVRGRTFSTINTSLAYLMTFAYEVHARQIVGGPAWLETDKYDLTAEPDGTGQPNDKQWKRMVQKLLADRFKLAFHRDRRELSVYAIVPARTGPKLTKSEGDPNGLPSLFFRALGNLPARNASMADLAGVMQAAVLDRPVVDQTGLTGRFDFTLIWTPDESQFVGQGVRVSAPTDNPDAPPGLFTAIEEQLGLRLNSTRAPVDVLVIDAVDHPTPD